MTTNLTNDVYDVFISHASEDKAQIARPLAQELQRRGYKVWLDEFELKLGDSLRQSIDAGLRTSRFGVVVLSPAFFQKRWTNLELNGLLAKEIESHKVILPIWHNITRDDIVRYSSPLADKLGVSTSQGITGIAEKIEEVIKPQEKVTSQRHSPQGFNFDELLVDSLDRIQELADNPTETIGIPTGIYDLDLLINGLIPGSLTLILGEPDSGKTAMHIHLAQHISGVSGLPTILLSRNNTAKQICDRIICSLGNIASFRYKTGKLLDQEWPALTEAIEKMRLAPLKIVESSEFTSDDLTQVCEDSKSHFGKIGCILMDQIELRNDDIKKYNGIVKKLKMLAEQFDCPVVATQKIPPIKSDDFSYIFRHLTNISGLAEQDIDNFIHLRQIQKGEINGNEVDFIEANVVRQKNGMPIGAIHILINKFSGALQNISTNESDVPD